MVRPTDTHKAHLKVMLDRIEFISQAGGGSPVAMQRYREHLEQHLLALGQTDKNLERQIRKELADRAKAMESQVPRGTMTTQTTGGEPATPIA